MLVKEMNVAMDAEGFMTDPKQWTPEIAEAFAAEEGIAPLTDAHWKVINWVRAEAAKTGEFPSLRGISKHSGVDTKQLYELFPKGPAKKIAPRNSQLASRISHLKRRPTMSEDRKLAIICSKGSLDMAYPGLILANAARMMGIEADLFFTFWGMDIITKEKVDSLKVVPVGNPAMHMPQFVGGLPGMTDMATNMMKKEIDKLDIPPVHEFLQMVHDAGCGIYACRMASDMMHLKKEDLVDEVDDIIGAMEFLEKAEGAQLLFI